LYHVCRFKLDIPPAARIPRRYPHPSFRAPSNDSRRNRSGGSHWTEIVAPSLTESDTPATFSLIGNPSVAFDANNDVYVFADNRGGVTSLLRTHFFRQTGRFSMVFTASDVCGASPN